MFGPSTGSLWTTPLLSLPTGAPAPPCQIFPVSCIGQDYSQHTHTHAHAHTRAHTCVVETTRHPFLPALLWLSQSCEGERSGLCWGHLGFVFLFFPPLSFSASLEADSPQFTTPPPIPANWLPRQPSWEAASYHGNPAWPPGCLA